MYVFRPSFLMGNRREVRTGERVGIALARVAQYALVGPLRKYRPIAAESVAGGMCGAARRESSGGRTVCEFDDILRLAGGRQ